MPLTTVVEENLNENEDKDEDENNIEKYIFWIEGYSLSSNVGFIKFEKGAGNNITDAVFDAYNKVKDKLCKKNIIVKDMKVKDYKVLPSDTQPSGFAFYPLTHEIIQSFREEVEIYLMSHEDYIVNKH